MCIEND
jgi:hypothetical protein